MSARAETVSAAPWSESALRRRRSLGVAILAGLGAAAALARFELGAHGVIAAAFVAVLVVLSAIDLERRVLPNRIVLPAAAAILAAQVAFFPERATEWVVSGVLAALFFFVPLLFRPGGMGMGDVKLALLMGFALGADVAPAVFIAVLAAAAVAIVLLVRGGTAARERAIPFGPFLAAGALVVLFGGAATRAILGFV